MSGLGRHANPIVIGLSMFVEHIVGRPATGGAASGAATCDSFNTLNTWHDEFLNQASPSDPKHFPFILVGNKIDLDGGNKRMVSEKKAREWCASKGDIPYFETSAKEDHNVDTAFLCIAKLALAHEHDQDIYFKTVAEQVPDTEQTTRCAC
ncbi:unnamed protein product [Urochloa humidicola]